MVVAICRIQAPDEQLEPLVEELAGQLDDQARLVESLSMSSWLAGVCAISTRSEGRNTQSNIWYTV